MDSLPTIIAFQTFCLQDSANQEKAGLKKEEALIQFKEWSEVMHHSTYKINMGFLKIIFMKH